MITQLSPKQQRAEILRLLQKLEPANREVFAAMYSPDNISKDIEIIVAEIPAKKLNWALVQCKNTYYKFFKEIGR